MIEKSEYIRAITMQIEEKCAIKAAFTLFESDEEFNYCIDLGIKIVDKKILKYTFSGEEIKDIKYKERINK